MSNKKGFSIDEFTTWPDVNIPADVLRILKELEALGFEIKAISPNGSYFEMLDRKNYRGEMWAQK